MSLRFLLIIRGDGSREPAVATELREAGHHVDWFAVDHRARGSALRQVLLSRRSFGSYDVVAASEYFLVFAICLRLQLRRKRPAVVALGFNQSRRLLLTGWAPVDRLLNLAWRRVAIFMVHSRQEAQLFARQHDIPSDRFVFSHWGYDLPQERSPVALPKSPFVTMVGRNNRDLPTFCKALELAGVAGVLITSEKTFRDSKVSIPPSIHLLLDRPLAECLAYVENCFAHLVLVVSDDRGAGHISAVTAMLTCKPQVFSNVSTIAEYLIDGYNGIAVPPRDAEATAAAITRLAIDVNFAADLAENGERFAREWMSNAAATRRTASVLIASARGDKPRETFDLTIDLPSCSPELRSAR